MPRYTFGPWEPDKAAFQTDSLQVCRNVYPTASGYRPIKGFVETLNGVLPEACRGAGSFVSPLGATTIIAGSATTLYRGFYDGWQPVGTGYNLQDQGRWRFAQYGSLAIATNGADPMLKIELQEGTVAPLGDGAAPEAGTPPRATLLAGVKDFLVAGVIDGDVRTLAWSGINDAEWWSYGTNQSDYQIMPSGGEITGIFGGEVGLILQRNRISRMTYVGDNVVFQFDEVSSNVGCVSPHSTAQWGNLGFFLSDTGFMKWDGADLKPIGQERVDRTFKASYGRKDWARMSAAIDPVNSLVIWSMNDRMFIYNWVLDRWSDCDFTAQIIFPGFSRDISIDELDAMYGNLDAIPVSLDDPMFLGGDPRFYIFNAASTLGNFSGGAMQATITGGSMEPAAGRDVRLRFVRSLTDDATGAAVTIATSPRLSQSGTTHTYAAVRANGDIPVRESGRYVTLGSRHSAGAVWTYDQGVDYTATAGQRQ